MNMAPTTVFQSNPSSNLSGGFIKSLYSFNSLSSYMVASGGRGEGKGKPFGKGFPFPSPRTPLPILFQNFLAAHSRRG